MRDWHVILGASDLYEPQGNLRLRGYAERVRGCENCTEMDREAI